LKRGSDGLWHEVTWKFVRKKASQALRERGRPFLPRCGSVGIRSNR
jgi:hypothetical protein